jgi:hypothetical protein
MTALIKTSREIKSTTNVVRQHLDAVERAREIYLAGIKRLEADYFDRIKRATEIITGENTQEASSEAEPAQTPAAEPEPAPTARAPRASANRAG